MKEIEIVFPAWKEPSGDDLRSAVAAVSGEHVYRIAHVEVLRRSLDARSREILYRYRVQVYMKSEPEYIPYSIPEYKDVSESEQVLVIGAGPAGLFAALKLLQEGLCPIIIERGKDVHSRKYDIAAISREGVLNPDSNYCYGEGGAGTFSDGKLYTRSNKRGNVQEVLYQFVRFGASAEILTDAHPHIGSDRLPGIIENMRHCIEEHGGQYRFGCRMTDLQHAGGRWKVLCSNGESFSARHVILATGHSAKEIYELFAARKWDLQAKGFALGVRVEHPQALINDIQYHGRFQNRLPAAEYSLVEQVDGRGVFSFCMCPGGVLVPSSTSVDAIVLNGMSNSKRNSRWANAGIVVSVEPEDIAKGNDPLAVLRFQEEIERRAFEVSGSFRAPAQRMTDFVGSGSKTAITSGTLPDSSYFPGVVSSSLRDVLPAMVADRLKKAFPLFDKKMKGYYTSEALLLAVESRTSSTVRIPRDPQTLEHVSLKGIYPCGEGAGYAGGIVSSALDGINCAARISLVAAAAR